MTATIRVPAYSIAFPISRDEDALKYAQQLRDEYPTIDVVVELSETPARQGDEVKQIAGATVPRPPYESMAGGVVDLLDIPGFLRRPFR